MEDICQTSSVGSITEFEDPRRISRKYKLSDFRVIRELGRGKYGVVLLALDLELDQLVALKVRFVILSENVILRTSGSRRVLERIITINSRTRLKSKDTSNIQTSSNSLDISSKM